MMNRKVHQLDKYAHPHLQKAPIINGKSKKLAMNKRPMTHYQGKSVHERLYKHDLEKTKIAYAKKQQEDQEKLERDMMKSPPRPVNSNELNVGVRLYQKGMKKQEEKERYCEDFKELREQKLEAELVFKPQINPQRSRQKSAERREETLLNYGKQVKEKRELAKQMIQYREDTQWDYQPKINKRSAKIIQERSQIMVMSPNN
mmetsp:Transcript_34058/g.33252  ORF Transcript_34058/g.33252 Transcript_34058/m.33252 type:complete len:202 (+) Transcript_34058:780-1385(+)